MIIYQQLFSEFKPKLKDPKNITDLEVLENAVLAYHHFRENRSLFEEYYPLTIDLLNRNTVNFFSPFFEYTMFVEAIKTLMARYEGSIPLMRAERSLYDILYRTRHYNDVKLRHKNPFYTDEELLASFSFEARIVEELKKVAERIKKVEEEQLNSILKKSFLILISNNTIETILLFENKKQDKIEDKEDYKKRFWSKVIEDLGKLYSKRT